MEAWSLRTNIITLRTNCLPQTRQNAKVITFNGEITLGFAILGKYTCDFYDLLGTYKFICQDIFSHLLKISKCVQQ